MKLFTSTTLSTLRRRRAGKFLASFLSVVLVAGFVGPPVALANGSSGSDSMNKDAWVAMLKDSILFGYGNTIFWLTLNFQPVINNNNQIEFKPVINNDINNNVTNENNSSANNNNENNTTNNNNSTSSSDASNNNTFTPTNTFIPTNNNDNSSTSSSSSDNSNTVTSDNTTPGPPETERCV